MPSGQKESIERSINMITSYQNYICLIFKYKNGDHSETRTCNYVTTHQKSSPQEGQDWQVVNCRVISLLISPREVWQKLEKDPLTYEKQVIGPNKVSCPEVL
jgi:hypothetical protein